MIKIYNINGVFKGVLGDEVKDVSTFSSQEDGGEGKLTVSMKSKEDLLDFEIGDELKYFKDSILLYSGNIVEIEEEENVSFNFIKLNVIGIAHFTGNFKFTKNYSDNLANIVADIVSIYNAQRGKNILSVGTIGTTGTININIGLKTFYEYFKELSKKSNIKFYITNTGVVNFSDGQTHSLTFAGDVESIKNIKTNDTIIDSTKLYNSIGIIVNNKYNYFNIKPLDKIKIQNNNKYKEIYTVAKIQYGTEKAIIELENFISFTKLLGN